jgi:hypothetical protein
LSCVGRAYRRPAGGAGRAARVVAAAQAPPTRSDALRNLRSARIGVPLPARAHFSLSLSFAASLASAASAGAGAAAPAAPGGAHMIEIVCNDRLGKKIRVKCKCVAARGGCGRAREAPRSADAPTATPARAQLRRHCRRPQEAHCRADGHAAGKDPPPKMDDRL